MPSMFSELQNHSKMILMVVIREYVWWHSLPHKLLTMQVFKLQVSSLFGLCISSYMHLATDFKYFLFFFNSIKIVLEFVILMTVNPSKKSQKHENTDTQW